MVQRGKNTKRKGRLVGEKLTIPRAVPDISGGHTRHESMGDVGIGSHVLVLHGALGGGLAEARVIVLGGVRGNRRVDRGIDIRNEASTGRGRVGSAYRRGD